MDVELVVLFGDEELSDLPIPAVKVLRILALYNLGQVLVYRRGLQLVFDFRDSVDWGELRLKHQVPVIPHFKFVEQLIEANFPAVVSAVILDQELAVMQSRESDLVPPQN